MDEIEKASKLNRKNTYQDICNAGFDISCVDEYDKKLIGLWIGEK